MDTSSLGTLFIENQRLTLPENGLTKMVNQTQEAVTGEKNFAETLKNARETANNSDTADLQDKTVRITGGAAHIDKTSKLYEQCVELEIFLVKNLITSMRSTVQKSGLIDEGFAGKIYEDMLYDEYARDFTKNANFGLAEQAYLELSGQRGKTLIRQ
jgi:flagellar protein FlgJ